MQQVSSSFWTDIKDLEERLAKSPDSFCFAKLSEVYLKVGLIDDALHVARQGVAKHPVYLAGHRALAMACHAKGLSDECLVALQRVTEAMPEDQESLKLLGRLSSEIGDRSAARQAFLTLLEFNPDDVECRLELESLEHPVTAALFSSTPDEFDDEEIIEDLEMLEELDILEDDDDSGFHFQEAVGGAASPDLSGVPQYDPLSTGTLAELYVSQGFITKALDIYRAILVDDPTNNAVSTRVAELELQAVAAEPPSLACDDFFEDEGEDEGEDEPLLAATAAIGVLSSAGALARASQTSGVGEVFEQKTAFLTSPSERPPSELPTQGSADNALVTLEGWLENIRRIRSCR